MILNKGVERFMYRNYIEKIAENLTNEDLLNDWQKVKKGITNNRRKKQ